MLPAPRSASQRPSPPVSLWGGEAGATVRDGSPPRWREATPLMVPVLPERPPESPFSLYQAQYPPAHLLPTAPECLPF